MDGFDFLKTFDSTEIQPIYVVTGDEDFLRRRSIRAIQKKVIGDGDPAFALSTLIGEETTFAQLQEDLETVPFLSDRRLAIVYEADKFISENRSRLEGYFTRPARTGVLILQVKTWNSATKLAKILPDERLIVCKSIAPYQAVKWCSDWAWREYRKRLSQDAAQLLITLVGAQLGVLDSELEKLTIYVDQKPEIDLTDVEELIGRSRGADVFKIMIAIGSGDPATAFRVLDELFSENQPPVGILGALSYTLRQLAQAARLYKQGMNLDEALDTVGVKNWQEARTNAKKQLKHLGYQRLEKIYEWLLEVDAGLKGGNPLPERLQLEALLVKLARQRPNA